MFSFHFAAYGKVHRPLLLLQLYHRSKKKKLFCVCKLHVKVRISQGENGLEVGLNGQRWVEFYPSVILELYFVSSESTVRAQGCFPLETRAAQISRLLQWATDQIDSGCLLERCHRFKALL